MKYANLHLHSVYSDGIFTPQELCALAKGKGYQAVALADHETVRGTTSYIIMFTALFIFSSVMIMAFEGCDILTGLSSVATCLNNVGPGLSEVGPTDTFAHLTSVSKLILCFNMLAGRLELFPILMLLSPSTWKKYS